MTTTKQDEIARLREALAEYAHEAWSGWMIHMFSKGKFTYFDINDGWQENWIMPSWAVARWKRQMNTPYSELSESEKESDRVEADNMLAILERIGEPATVPVEVLNSLYIARGSILGTLTFLKNCELETGSMSEEMARDYKELGEQIVEIDKAIEWAKERVESEWLTHRGS
jgi:hypothetical protein